MFQTRDRAAVVMLLVVGWIGEEHHGDAGCLVMLAGAAGALPAGRAGSKCPRP